MRAKFRVLMAERAVQSAEGGGHRAECGVSSRKRFWSVSSAELSMSAVELGVIDA